MHVARVVAIGLSISMVFSQAAGQPEALAAMAKATLLRRLLTLEEVANVAAFMAPDRARVMTGTVVKLNCGSRVD